MPRDIDRAITNQVCPIDNDQGATAVERLVIAHAAHAAHAALQAATVALDRVEATVCADIAHPATDPVYRAVVRRRLAARAALSVALRKLRVSPAVPS